VEDWKDNEEAREEEEEEEDEDEGRSNFLRLLEEALSTEDC
jgi:hypothetical protein